MTKSSTATAVPDPAIAAELDLVRAPADFIDNPYPYYAAMRSHDPVHAMPGGMLLTGYDDVVAVYRNRCASSDKKVEFSPKLGESPLYEHHTTSLVCKDPPLHTRVRRIIMGALSQHAIARIEANAWAYLPSPCRASHCVTSPMISQVVTYERKSPYQIDR